MGGATAWGTFAHGLRWLGTLVIFEVLVIFRAALWALHPGNLYSLTHVRHGFAQRAIRAPPHSDPRWGSHPWIRHVCDLHSGYHRLDAHSPRCRSGPMHQTNSPIPSARFWSRKVLTHLLGSYKIHV